MRNFFELVNKTQFSDLYYAVPFVLAVTLYFQSLFPLNVQHPNSIVGLLWWFTFFIQSIVWVRLFVSLHYKATSLIEYTSKEVNPSGGDISVFADLYSKIKIHKIFFISVLLPLFISSNFYTNIPTVVYPVGKFTPISLLGDFLVIFSFAVVFSQKGLYPYLENFLFKTEVLSNQKWFKVEITFKMPQSILRILMWRRPQTRRNSISQYSHGFLSTGSRLKKVSCGHPTGITGTYQPEVDNVPQSKGLSTIVGSVVSIGPYLSIKRNDGLVEVIRWKDITRIALDMHDHAIIRGIK